MTILDHLKKPKDSKEIIAVNFGPKGGWYVGYNDGSCAWETLPESLDAKLSSRSTKSVKISSISISELGTWVIVYENGLLATSLTIVGKLQDALSDADSDIKSIILGPASAWIVLRKDGTFSHDRLPSGLESLLNKRTCTDPIIDSISLGAFGSWFIRFDDGECLWEGLPKSLEKFLIKMIRKGHDGILLSLSLSCPSNYFVAIGGDAEISFSNTNFRNAISLEISPVNCS